MVGFSGRGEMIPNENSYCDIDPSVKDRWSIPVLRFHWKWTDHEYNQVRHMQQTFRALIEAMGGQAFGKMPTREERYDIARGGEIIHELGGARMGSDPKSSAVNAFNRTHDVPNLFIADGAPFVSQADKNPTWTIMALSWRMSDHIMELSKQGAL
jgi:choline dehydrogenase-like flavoprotein